MFTPAALSEKRAAKAAETNRDGNFTCPRRELNLKMELVQSTNAFCSFLIIFGAFDFLLNVAQDAESELH